MEDLSDAVASEAAQNAFLRGRADALDDGLFTLEGGAAVEAAPAAEGQLGDLRDVLLDRIDDPDQRARLASDLDAHMDVARSDIARHVGRQTKAWDRAVRAERVGLLQDRARRDYASGNKLALYGEAAATAGASPEAARSSVLRSGIEGALSDGQHGTAIDLHRNLIDQFTSDDAKALAPQMAVAAQMQTGRDYVEGVLPQPFPATAEATQVAHDDATARNAADWAHDPTQQATNQHLIDVQFGSHQRGLRQVDAQREQALQEWLGRSNADGNPQTERPPPALWTQLTDDQRQKVDARLAANARGEVVSDIPVTDEAMHQDGTQIARADGPVTARGFTYEQVPPELDPHKLNRPVPPEEQKEIENTLNKFLTGQFADLHPHGYKNYPHDLTGAVLPPSSAGYVAIDVPNAAADRGETRIIIDKGTQQIYCTNTHYRSFYPIRLNP